MSISSAARLEGSAIQNYAEHDADEVAALDIDGRSVCLHFDLLDASSYSARIDDEEPTLLVAYSLGGRRVTITHDGTVVILGTSRGVVHSSKVAHEIVKLVVAVRQKNTSKKNRQEQT